MLRRANQKKPLSTERSRLLLKLIDSFHKTMLELTHLIEVFEHHGEFAKSFLGYTRLVASLDLLLQVVLHTHCQLIELIPSLRQTNSAEKFIACEFDALRS